LVRCLLGGLSGGKVAVKLLGMFEGYF